MNLGKISMKKTVILFLFFVLVTGWLVLRSTLPLSFVSSNDFTFLKMDDGTYKVTKYSGSEPYVEIPKEVRGVEVTKISNFAFENNTYIETVVIGNNIVEIGTGCFRGCTSLKSLTVPFVGGSNDHNCYLDYIFSGYGGHNLIDTSVPSSLKEIYIAKGCTKISTSAFYLCDSIEEIHIPSTVTLIDDGTGYTSIGVNGNSPSAPEERLPFYGCSESLIIYCSASKKPENWGAYWNYISSSEKARVFWSSKEY